MPHLAYAQNKSCLTSVSRRSNCKTSRLSTACTTWSALLYVSIISTHFLKAMTTCSSAWPSKLETWTNFSWQFTWQRRPSTLAQRNRSHSKLIWVSYSKHSWILTRCAWTSSHCRRTLSRTSMNSSIWVSSFYNNLIISIGTWLRT